MNESLKALLKLQEIDSEIIFLQEAKAKRPRELESDRRRLEERKRIAEKVAQEIKKLQLESARRELDLKRNEGEVGKLQIALNQAKSNQEYQILKEQIGRLVGEDGRIEEEILRKLGEVDGLEKGMKEAEGEYKTFQAEFKKREDELNLILKGIEEKLADLSKRRGEAAKEIPADHLQIYERVLARHKDFALARIESQVCQGCHMSITTQTINLLMLGRELHQCRNCLRILYLD